jgi:hypothetical protein
MSSLAGPGLPSEKEDHRLPIGQAAVVIVSLAVLSWAVLIAIVMGLRALLLARTRCLPRGILSMSK